MAQRPIDEKLVVMKMNISDLKAKAKETTGIFGGIQSAFDKLRGNRLNKVSDDINGINRSAQKVDMSNIARSLDTISSRFSNLGVIATTALANITNKAVNAGASLMHNLGPAQVSSGFSEYELKMKSIGTMLANTEWEGKNLKDVQKNLDELNEYADKTIYSFGEMTASIGRFTAAGVGLDDSTIAIKGLGNLAAISGSSVEQLNTAMYQVSQGMAAGKFGLEDWNSMVNAGMGGKKTQDALLATAKAMGKNVDMSDGFRLSLQKGWLTSEVFLSTLRQFGEDESMTEAATAVRTFSGMMDALKESIGSGWATSFEIIFGDYEQATEFWTRISNAIGGIFQKSTDNRNALLRAIMPEDGLNGFVKFFDDITKPIEQVTSSIKKSFSEVFSSGGGEKDAKGSGILGLVETFKKLSTNVELSEQNVQSIQTIFKGMFSIVDIGVNLFKSFVDILKNLNPGLESVGTGILSLLAFIFQLPIAINEFIESGTAFSRTTEFLGDALLNVSKGTSFVIDNLYDLGTTASQVFSILAKGEYAGGLGGENSKVVSILFTLREAFVDVFTAIGSLRLSDIGNGITMFVDFVAAKFQSMKDALSNVKEFVAGVGDSFVENQGWILAGGIVASLGAVIWKLWEAFSAITGSIGGFGDITESLSEVFESIGGSLKAFTLGIHTKSLLTIATAVGILAVSLLVLSKLDGPELAKSLTAVVGSLGALVGALILFSKFSVTGSLGVSLTIVAMATAMVIMAQAIEDLAAIKFADVVKGVAAIAALMGTMAGSMALLSKNSAAVSVTAFQILAIGGALLLISKAMTEIAKIKTSSIIKSVAAITGILAAMSMFLILTKATQFGPASAVGIIAIAVAVKMITKDLERLSKIQPEKLMKALTTIVAILAALSIFSMALSKVNMASLGTNIFLLASALTLLIVPISALGLLPWPVLLQGLGALVVTLGLLALATKLMTTAIPGAAALVIIAVALNLLVPAITALGLLPWEVVALGIGGLAVALLAVGGVSALLAPAAGGLMIFAAAIALLGIGLGAVGIGVGAFAKGMAILVGLSATAMAAVTAAIMGFVAGVTTMLPAITDLLYKIVESTLNVMIRMAPKIADGIVKLIHVIFDKFEEHYPGLAEAGKDAFLTLLKGMEDTMPEMLEASAQFVADMITGLIQEIADMNAEIITAGGETILGFLEGMSIYIPQVIKEGNQFIIDLINGLADGIRQNGPQMTDAMLGLMGELILTMNYAAVEMLDAVYGWIPGVSEALSAMSDSAEESLRERFNLTDTANEKGDEFSGALSGKSDGAKNAGIALANAGIQGAESVSATSSGINFAQGFASGIGNGGVLNTVIGSAKRLALSAWNTINKTLDIRSPSRKTDKSGQDTGQGFANGIKKKEKTVKKAAKSVAETAREAFDKASEKLSLKLDDGSITAKSYIKSMQSLKKAYSGYADIVREANNKIFEQEKAIIENKKYYNQLNLKQELAAWNRLESMYKKGSKNQLEVAKEVYRVKQELRDKEYDDAKTKIDDRKYYNEMSLTKELAAWRALYKKLNKWSDEAKEVAKEIYRVKQELKDKEFSDFKSDLEDKKYYNKLSLEEELAAWRKQYKGLSKTSDEAKEAVKEIYRLKKELAEKEVEDFKDGLDTRKYYNNLSLKEELDAWTAHSKKYKEGTKERIEADKELYRIKNEMYTKLKDLGEDYTNKILEAEKAQSDGIKAINEQRMKDIDDYANKMATAYGIFDEVTKKNDVSGEKLLQNQKDQLTNMTDWMNDIRELTARGVDDELLKSLKELGPSAAEEIAALTTLTGSQLAEYSDIWKTKNELAKSEAIYHLKDINDQADNQIEELKSNTSKQLEEYKKEWASKIQEIKTGVKDEYIDLEDDMSDIGSKTLSKLIEGMTAMTPDLLETVGGIADSIRDTINDTLGIQAIGKVDVDVDAVDVGKIKSKIQAAVDAINKGMTEIKEQNHEIEVSVVYDYSKIDLARAKLALIPDTSYYRDTMEIAAKERVLKATGTSVNPTSNKEKDSDAVGKALAAFASKPIETKVYLDGEQITKTVSNQQYKQTVVGGLTKGVIV